MIQTPAGFEGLPDEILENILYQVPHGDLLPNATRVCRKWRDVITSPRFMPYKKLYYAYKKGKGAQFDEAQIRIENMVRSADAFMDGASFCFLGFVKRMGAFIPLNLDGSVPRIKRELEKMPEYAAVVTLFDEQAALKECMDTSTEPPEPNPLCVLATMLVLANGVDATTSLLRRLLRSRDVPLSLVMEMFYAAATFFLFFHRTFKVPDKHHYVVFAAIHAFESRMQVAGATLEGLFDRHKVKDKRREELRKSQRFSRMTHEQFKIISHDIGGNDVTKINAFAGTGKTTTLISYAEIRSEMKFLYIAYNKSIQMDAEKRFPANVTCRTIHSIARAVTGWPYSEHKKIGNLNSGAVFTALGHSNGFSTFARATYAIRTVEAFIASVDTHILLDHVPTWSKDGPLDEGHRDRYLQDACYLWQRMKNLRDNSINMTHDGYLKLFQLRPQVDFAKAIKADRPFDVILVDEAQDMTPASIDLLQRQNVPRILVGDPNQQIYCFRGAVNAMSLIQGSAVFYLTQSFRFGPTIAHLCDSLLTGMKGLGDRTVIGNDDRCTINGDVVGQLCVITRTNSEQFSEVVKAIAKADYWTGGGSLTQTPRPLIAFTGEDKKEAFFKELLDVFHLYNGQKNLVQNAYIKKFGSYQELHGYSERVEDVVILGKCQIVEKFRNDVSRHVEEIKRHMTDDQDWADILFSTAHKAKGLEFDTVKVVNDFGVSPDLDGCKEDEKNLLYVAVSRAKKCLIMNETLISILRRLGESFVSLRPNPVKASGPLDPSTIAVPAQRCVVRRSLSPGEPFQTTQCGNPTILENSWILRRPALKITSPYEETSPKNSVEDGSFCRKHGFMVMPAFIPFLKTPSNLPEPKEKLRFSINGLLGAGDPAEENAVDESVDYDRIMLDHFNPAFKRPGVFLVVRHGEIMEMMGLG